MPKIVTLTCSCCGSSTQGRQWPNRDIDFGLCEKCADWLDGRESPEAMKQNYGENGIHYRIP